MIKRNWRTTLVGTIILLLAIARTLLTQLFDAQLLLWVLVGAGFLFGGDAKEMDSLPGRLLAALQQLQQPQQQQPGAPAAPAQAIRPIVPEQPREDKPS